MRAAEAASISTRSMETSMERLSTGKRINASSDDAAGVAISSRLSAEIRGANQAIRNSLDGQALIDTAEGAHKEIENILQRMREIAVQSANDTNNGQDRTNLQAEMGAMITEIDRIAETTTWAGTNLMEADTSSFSFQVGTATGAANQILVDIGGMGSDNLSLTTDGVAYNASTKITSAQHTDVADPDTNAAFNSVTITGGVGGADAQLKIADPGTAHDTLAALTVTLSGVDVTLTGDANDDVQAINAAWSDFGVQAEVKSTITDLTKNYALAANDTVDYINLKFTDVPVPATISVEASVGVTANENSRTAITTIDTAIRDVNIQRSELGAISNRLNHTVNNLTNISSNLSAAKGGIEDADFALETTNLAKNQILQQASTAMLAQANASKQNVLSLLQG
jgi:flagellin